MMRRDIVLFGVCVLRLCLAKDVQLRGKDAGTDATTTGATTSAITATDAGNDTAADIRCEAGDEVTAVYASNQFLYDATVNTSNQNGTILVDWSDIDPHSRLVNASLVFNKEGKACYGTCRSDNPLTRFLSHWFEYPIPSAGLIVSALLLCTLLMFFVRACLQKNDDEPDGDKEATQYVFYDEAELKTSTVRGCFIRHLFMWASFPFTVPLILMLFCMTRTMRQDIARSWSCILSRWRVYDFKYLTIGTLIALVNLCCVVAFLRFHGVDSEIVSPVEYAQAFASYYLLLGLWVMSYNDKTFENLIERRQRDLIQISMLEEHDEPSNFSEVVREGEKKSLHDFCNEAPKFKSVADLLQALKFFYPSHFSGRLILNKVEQIASWLFPFCVMLVVVFIPRFWMKHMHNASPLPSKNICGGDFAEFACQGCVEEYNIWLQIMLLHNELVTLVSGTIFMRMVIVCYSEFTRAIEQLLLLDAFMTDGFDQLPAADQVQLKRIAWKNYSSLLAKYEENTSGGSKLDVLEEAEIDVFICRASLDASPIRKKRYYALGLITEKEKNEIAISQPQYVPETENYPLKGRKKKWVPPIHMDLRTLKGIRLWWGARQWLSLDIRDERATMEMLLVFSIIMIGLISLVSVWYICRGATLTLLVSLSMVALSLLVFFVVMAMNKCIHMNGLMQNDALMLMNIRYYLHVEKSKAKNRESIKESLESSLKVAGEHGAPRPDLDDPDDDEDVDKMLDLMVTKVERLDELHMVFGFVIDSALRAKLFSAIVLIDGSALLNFLWRLANDSATNRMMALWILLASMACWLAWLVLREAVTKWIADGKFAGGPRVANAENDADDESSVDVTSNLLRPSPAKKPDQKSPLEHKRPEGSIDPLLLQFFSFQSLMWCIFDTTYVTMVYQRLPGLLDRHETNAFWARLTYTVVFFVHAESLVLELYMKNFYEHLQCNEPVRNVGIGLVIGGFMCNFARLFCNPAGTGGLVYITAKLIVYLIMMRPLCKQSSGVLNQVMAKCWVCMFVFLTSASVAIGWFSYTPHLQFAQPRRLSGACDKDGGVCKNHRSTCMVNICMAAGATWLLCVLMMAIVVSSGGEFADIAKLARARLGKSMAIVFLTGVSTTIGALHHWPKCASILYVIPRTTTASFQSFGTGVAVCVGLVSIAQYIKPIEKPSDEEIPP